MVAHCSVVVLRKVPGHCSLVKPDTEGRIHTAQAAMCSHEYRSKYNKYSRDMREADASLD